MNKHYIIFLSLFLFSSTLIAQSFGIRAGLNYTKFSGPLEQGVNEKFSLANGFHFGVNYAYKMADIFSIKGELVYTQIGSKYNYEGDSFYKIPIGSNAFSYEKGKSTIEMKISNAYISLPVTFQWQASKKLELYAGGYASILIGPKGNGTIYFEQSDSLFFKQSLIHSYNKDEAGGIATNAIGPSVWVDGKIETLDRDAGAYYNLLANEKEANLYNTFDYGITGGFNYFINKGFYVGFKYDYGLTDVTNDKVDFLRKTFDEENNLSTKANHFDRNVGFEVSFGFRF
jgi:hypothetical protein